MTHVGPEASGGPLVYDGFIFTFTIVQRMADPARIKTELPKAAADDEETRPEDTEGASTSGCASNETKDSADLLKPKEESKNVSRRHHTLHTYMYLMNDTGTSEYCDSHLKQSL